MYYAFTVKWKPEGIRKLASPCECVINRAVTYLGHEAERQLMLRYGGSQGTKIWKVVTNASIFRIKGKM
jgi:hypothetical protein